MQIQPKIFDFINSGPRVHVHVCVHACVHAYTHVENKGVTFHWLSKNILEFKNYTLNF